MDGSADRFLELMHQLEDFTRAVSPEQAHTQFDETTLQLFWMRWPQLSAWAGSLWPAHPEQLEGRLVELGVRLLGRYRVGEILKLMH